MSSFIFLFFQKAYAVSVGVNLPSDPNKTDYTFKCYLVTLYRYSLTIGFSLSMLMIIFAGIKYLTSQGNQNQINDAKDIVTGTLLGFAILVLIKVILHFLGPEFPSC